MQPTLVIHDEWDQGEVDAYYSPSTKAIHIPRELWEQAKKGQRRAIWTLAHECGHHYEVPLGDHPQPSGNSTGDYLKLIVPLLIHAFKVGFDIRAGAKWFQWRVGKEERMIDCAEALVDEYMVKETVGWWNDE